MKKIKFRVWHKNEKRWLDPWAEEDPILSLKDSGEGCEVYIYERKAEEHSNINCQMGDVVIQQYIGLNDINGQEIYEGDIVQIKPDWFYQFKHSGEIYFSDKNLGYYYKCTSHDKLKIDWNIGKTFECEVIGNINEQNSRN